MLVSRGSRDLYLLRRGLIEALQRDGWIVHTAGEGEDGYRPLLETLQVPFTPLYTAKNAVAPLEDIRLCGQLYCLYRSQRPDIVHHYKIKPVIYGSIAARLAGVPRVINTITGLGYTFTANSNRGLRRLVEGLYRVALRGAHLTLFQNRDDQALFLARRLVRPDRTALIPGSGVDTRFFAPVESLNGRNGNHPLTFLMVARLLRDKGLYEYVEAARSVLIEHPDTTFQLLGSRDEHNPTVVSEEELNTWEREKIVCCLGERPDIRPTVANADVVVLPSYREGTPRALLEAAAMGKPLITTDAVGCREVVDEGVNGLRVPIQDSAALAEAMRRMIREPEMRQRMGQAGREKILREFDEQIVIRMMLEAYSKTGGGSL